MLACSLGLPCIVGHSGATNIEARVKVWGDKGGIHIAPVVEDPRPAACAV
jgi:hypothetical protein